MNHYLEILNLISRYIIKGIFVSVLVIIIIGKVSNGKVNMGKAIAIIAHTLIVYAALAILYYLITLIICLLDQVNSTAFWVRATGKYWFAYWLMLISGTIVPLLLLFKKLRLKIYFVLMVSIIVNIGWLFESFAMHATSFHDDYGAYLPFDHEMATVVNGCLLGLIVIALGNLNFQKLLNRVR